PNQVPGGRHDPQERKRLARAYTHTPLVRRIARCVRRWSWHSSLFRIRSTGTGNCRIDQCTIGRSGWRPIRRRSQSRRPSMWRHGDVFIQTCDAIPTAARRLPHNILAKGEATGHAHRIVERDAASLWQADDVLYLEVSGQRATIEHEEHAPITL